MQKHWRAVDLFAGCGGLTAGLKRAGFHVVSAVEIDDLAVSTYVSNHPEVNLVHDDIVDIHWQELHREHSLNGGYNFEIALTGAKMHAVGAAMLASTALPASVYYSRPTRFNPAKFTKGTGVTRIVHLKRTAVHGSGEVE